MTSAERKESRRIRRSDTGSPKTSRRRRVRQFRKKWPTLNALMSASKKARSGITWKASVQAVFNESD